MRLTVFVLPCLEKLIERIAKLLHGILIHKLCWSRAARIRALVAAGYCFNSSLGLRLVRFLCGLFGCLQTSRGQTLHNVTPKAHVARQPEL